MGYVFDQRGLYVDLDNVEIIIEVPPPKIVKEVRQIIGTFSWYRRFVPEVSTIVSLITALVKKSSKYLWTHECDNAFRKIK